MIKLLNECLQLVWSLSGSFTLCRHLRPSSGREHTLVLIQSGDDDYLINETMRKPTTGTRCPTLFGKWHRTFYMPSHTDTVGHTKAFIESVMDYLGGGGSQSAPA